MAEDFSKGPTKQEARMRLGGVPERSFDRWLSENNVKVAYVDASCIPGVSSARQRK